MHNSPQDLYAKCLPNHRGYPLWFPEPSSMLPSNYREDGLQIGDVGYVSQKGTFNVLFNLCYGPNHALHQRSGVSFSFDCIALDFDREVEIISNADPPGCVITSTGITQPNPTSPRTGYYEFTPSSAKGAILILPDGATSHDVPASERFRRVAIEHAVDWYKIAKEHHGESISSGSLYLLTGFYKARSWSLASFRDATATESRHIRVVPRDGEGTISGREWRCTFPVEYRDGPGPDHGGSVNQAVFISGFKIAVRDDMFGWLFQAQELDVQSVPAVRPRKRLGGFTASLMEVFSKKITPKLRRGGGGGADVDRVPALSRPFHPSDIINRYRLNKDPNALVAVTHDSEWITLIETGKLTPEELTQEDRLEAFLSESYSLVSQPENSAVHLQGKRPSTDFFQVVITCIRAHDVVVGFRRMPVGFYVLFQFDGTKRRTRNKPVCLHDSVVEWDDRIQLPSEPSATVQLSVHASFEFLPMLGNGEVLRTVDICVGDLVDNTRLITFSSNEGEPVSPCSSLFVTMERRRSDLLGAASDHNEDYDWEESSDLARLTDQGHDALLRCDDDTRKENVAVSIEYFKRALSICPNDHKCHAAALCNLAMAHFINCQIDRGTLKLSTSISYYREALELRHVDHPDRPVTMLHLAKVLLYQYGKLGFEEIPGEIMKLTSEVQASCFGGSHEHRAADLVVQTYALYRAIGSGSLAYIDRLIPALRQAAQDIPHDYFDKLQRLTNLVLALWIRYEFLGDLRDLDESIAIHAEAMLFTRSGLNSPVHTQLLNERVNATLDSGSWKDALVTAASFVVPTFAIYRVICERLETTDRITDASECLRQMVDELAKQADVHDEYVQWVLGKLESFGDNAMSTERHYDAISQYSIALSLNPAAPQGLFIKRSKAYIAKGLWENALNDANEVITLDPSSPWGYERKHAALHGAGRYGDAISTFETMLLKMSQSPDPEIRERHHEYVNPEQTKTVIRAAIQKAIRKSSLGFIKTHSGRFLAKPGQARSFESQPIFLEMISSMTTHIDHARIEHEVAQYYRYLTFSHDPQPALQLGDDDIVVFVVGPSGSGKSLFVEEVTRSGLIKVGTNLQPRTANVQAIRCRLTEEAKADLDATQNNIVFVDTPSFHTGVPDEAAEKAMNNWLRKSKSKSNLVGTIYMHRVETDPRNESIQKHLNTFAYTFPQNFVPFPKRLHAVLSYEGVIHEDTIRLRRETFQAQLHTLCPSLGGKQWNASLHPDLFQAGHPETAWQAVVALFTHLE